ncbi:hypothetical protein Pcinc_037548 [Petrolisthes cinctipes]|uniref:Uncharacterized protein n=1 Tax=Petrolisthes cinctipes TaxID=88211 RepID=A0AAE1ELF3_PETCI|nr:hypothetical protein Pcinc_037548 [Petrolisthes cinctipes]
MIILQCSSTCLLHSTQTLYTSRFHRLTTSTLILFTHHIHLPIILTHPPTHPSKQPTVLSIHNPTSLLTYPSHLTFPLHAPPNPPFYSLPPLTQPTHPPPRRPALGPSRLPLTSASRGVAEESEGRRESSAG